MTDWLSEVLDGFENHPKTCRDIHCAKTGHFPAFDKAHKLISAQLIRERLEGMREALDLVGDPQGFTAQWKKKVETRFAALTNQLKKVEDE